MIDDTRDMFTIEHFRRLAPDVQRHLAEQHGLTEPDDDPDTPPATLAARYLLRARDRGKMDDLATAVQLAPQ